MSPSVGLDHRERLPFSLRPAEGCDISLFQMKIVDVATVSAREERTSNRGGARTGAGRPKLRPSRVPHRARPEHDPKHPVHVTIRAVRYLPSLRSFQLARAVGEALLAVKARGRTVTQFTVQVDHLHLIVEAADKRDLIRVIRGTMIAIAKRINHQLGRRGPVFADRYHTRAVADPRSVRSAIVYVLMNHKKHFSESANIDPLSSARWFDGFKSALPRPSTPCPVSPSRTELGARAWRSFGLIDPAEAPRSGWAAFGLTAADIHPEYRHTRAHDRLAARARSWKPR